MFSDIFFISILLVFIFGFIWLGYNFLKKKRQERIEILTRELEKDITPSSDLESALQKTKHSFISQLKSVLSNKDPLQDSIFQEVERVLYSADVGATTTRALLLSLTNAFRDKKIENCEDAKKMIEAEITKILTSVPSKPLSKLTENSPSTFLFVGVNGVGKTTTIGKISALLQQKQQKVVLGAGDTFRAAASEQLSIWADRSNAKLVTGKDNSDPSSVLFDAVKTGQKENADFVLCDTAGRLHTKTDLMEELRKVHKVLNKAQEGAPHETLLVIDATTGQNAIMQAKQFAEVTPLTGIILTKLDGTAKGGVVIGIVNELKVPIRYIGIGEQIDNLKPFDPESFAQTLLN